MSKDATSYQSPIPNQLINAALECFLNDDYHKVTTRQISAKANTNISMIRYYFGNKEGLFEEMIKQTLQPLIDVLDSGMLETSGGFNDYFILYYQTMQKNPKFPVLILKVIALNQGPGKRFVHQLLERGRAQGRKRLEQLKSAKMIDESVDADIVRIAFVSLAMMPMLLQDVLEEGLEKRMDTEFLNKLASFNGYLFSSGLAPK